MIPSELLPPAHTSWNGVIGALPEAKQSEIIEQLSDTDVLSMSGDWFLKARREQIPPNWDWIVWVAMAGRGWEKALRLDQLIPTPDGFTRMGDLEPGDKVFSEMGEVCTIVGTSPIWLGADCFEVEFSDGQKIVTNGDHLWTVETFRSRKSAARGGKLKAETLNTRTMVKSVRVHGTSNYSILNTGPLNLPEVYLPIDPYVLGAWLGDGTSQEAELCCEDLQIVEEINKAGVETVERVNKAGIHYYRLGREEGKRDGTTGQFVANGSVHSELRALDLLSARGSSVSKKRIPFQYMRASASQRLALLQGLMDTDGSIETKAGAGEGRCEISQKSETLANQILELASSLGLKCTKSTCASTLYGVRHADRHRIKFTPFIPVFRLKRKLRGIRKWSKELRSHGKRFITAIREIDSVPTKCIHVDSPRNLYLVGRAFIPTHNNWTGSNWLTNCHLEGTAKNSGIIAATSADLRRFCIEGPSGVLTLAPTWYRPDYRPSQSKLVWPDGAETLLFTSEKPDRLRGPNLDKVWCDELAAWKYLDETWAMLQLCLRHGPLPQAMVTTTPRPKLVLRELMKRENKDVAFTRGATYDNSANLPERFLAEILSAYAGTRLERQEIYGELLNEFEGALWSYSLLDRCRSKSGECPTLGRIGIGVDPAISSEEGSDLTGIVTAGLGAENKHGYVLGEHSLRASPEQWARKVIMLYEELGADFVVAEKNQGGEMVEAVIKAVDASVNVILVHASRAKITRAEPIAAYYEQNRVHHVGTFPELEDQMCLFLPGEIKKSPDRVDALVWILTELMGAVNLVSPSIRRLH